MDLMQSMELASYVVTVVGLPFGIAVYVLEQRKERRNEEEELYQELSDEYTDFMRLALEHSDLKLFRRQSARDALTEEQQERKGILFGILVSLFERAYLLVYEDQMPRQTQRLWKSWEDYMREWCRREDFRALLPALLEGEDEEFCALLRRLAREETPVRSP